MKHVIGIDEVGRGPIAGPTAVGVFRLSSKIVSPNFHGKLLSLRDSKKLSPEKRQAWFAHMQSMKKAGKCDFAVAMVSASIIDRIGIAQAIRNAMQSCLKKVGATARDTILLDGSLYAPKEFKNQTTIIQGDEKEPAIALASIAAKVTRDRYMQKMAQKHPNYGFETHVGYGTKKHYAAIKKYGLTDLHRRSFLKKIT